MMSDPNLAHDPATPIPTGRSMLRARTLAARLALSHDERLICDARIRDTLDALLDDSAPITLAAYWPMRGEPDLRSALHDWHARGIQVALPHVVARGQPMTFGRWTPDSVVREHRYGGLVDNPGAEVFPELILIPCVAFDDQRYRLGYGGGYYDRTLAALPAMTWGVAYECCHVPSIGPQSHDVRLSRIVTERQVY